MRALKRKMMLLLLAFIACTPFVYATTLVIPNTFIGGTLILPTPMNNNFSAIANWANGNIDHTNLSSSAGITLSQLNLSSGALNLVASGATPTWGSGVTGDSVARITMYGDGTLGFGPGGGAAQDSFLWRSGANAFEFSSADGSGTPSALTIAALTSAAITSSGNVSTTGTLSSGANGGTGGQLTMKGSTSGSVVQNVPAAAGSATYTWPGAAPSFTPGSTANGATSGQQNLGGPASGVLAWGNIGPRFIGTAINPPVVSTTYTLAHGLPVAPTKLWTIWQCTTSNAGYAIGDRVVQFPACNSSSVPFTMQADGTNVYVYFSGASGIPIFVNKGTNAQTAIALADWEVFVYAEP